MTEQMERLVAPAEALEITGATPAAVPVLITEAEVVFSTAAAVPLQPAGWRIRASRLAVAMQRAFASSTVDDDGPRYRHYPKRLQYLEDARIGREMSRL